MFLQTLKRNEVMCLWPFLPLYWVLVFTGSLFPRLLPYSKVNRPGSFYSIGHRLLARAEEEGSGRRVEVGLSSCQQ